MLKSIFKKMSGLRFQTRIGEAGPVRDLPTTASDLSAPKIKTLEDLKTALRRKDD